MHEFWLILVINRSSVRGRRGISKSMDMREGEVILRGSGKCKICCLSWSSKSPWLKNGMARLLVALNEAFEGITCKISPVVSSDKSFWFSGGICDNWGAEKPYLAEKGWKERQPNCKKEKGGMEGGWEGKTGQVINKYWMYQITNTDHNIWNIKFKMKIQNAKHTKYIVEF